LGTDGLGFEVFAALTGAGAAFGALPATVLVAAVTLLLVMTLLFDLPFFAAFW